METAVLSTTAKVKARTDRKKKDGGDAEMTDSAVSMSKAEVKETAAEETKMDVDEEAKKKEEEEEEKKEEPAEAVLNNPLRVVKQ